jgi:hypothetical protein
MSGRSRWGFNSLYSCCQSSLCCECPVFAKHYPEVLLTFTAFSAIATFLPRVTFKPSATVGVLAAVVYTEAQYRALARLVWMSIAGTISASTGRLAPSCSSTTLPADGRYDGGVARASWIFVVGA